MYKTFHLFILVFIITLSCDKGLRNENETLLCSVAEAIVQEKPQDALDLINSINTATLSESELAFYTLLHIRAWGISGKNISAYENKIIEVMNYFAEKKDAPKTLLACYTLGSINIKQNNSPVALFYFLKADEWAAKLDYLTPYFVYTDIPYNIALLYSYEQSYSEGLVYLDKVYKHIVKNSYATYINTLLALELEGLIYHKLKDFEKANEVFNRALKLANENNDFDSKNRIIHNIGLVLTQQKLYIDAINIYKSVIFDENRTENKDKGLAYIALSKVYRNNNQPDSAIHMIKKSLPYFEENDYINYIQIYKSWYLAEEAKGNVEDAIKYKDRYQYLKHEQEKLRLSQQAELQKELERQQQEAEQNLAKLAVIEMNWQFAHKQIQHNKQLSFLVFFTIAGMVLLYAWNRRRQHADNEVFEIRLLNKEYQFRNIKQYYELIELGNWVEENLGESKAGKDLMRKIDDLVPSAHWELHPKFYDKHYKRMFDNFKQDFPYLSTLEYAILCLICIKIYDDRREMADVLEVSDIDFKNAEKSMKTKLMIHGYNFDKLMYRSRIIYNINQMNHCLFMPTRQYHIWRYKISRFFNNFFKH